MNSYAIAARILDEAIRRAIPPSDGEIAMARQMAAARREIAALESELAEFRRQQLESTAARLLAVAALNDAIRLISR